MTYLRQLWAVAAKDIRSEIRTKEALNAALAFAAVILVLFSFAFDQAEGLETFSGGLLWLAWAFAGALILNRSFARELHNDCLDALVSSPAPASAVFLGKALANYGLLIVVELISLGIFAVFYDVRLSGKLPLLLLVTALATWGMTIIGTIFSALTVNLHMRELMLPVLVYPFLIPVLMSAMLLTTDLLAGVPLAANLIWLRVLVAFDVVFTALAMVSIEVVLVG
jgi:heme exporter protein B